MNIKVAACAAIINNKKILMIKRADIQEHFPNHWGLPGGGVKETDKNLESTVTREVQEEINLEFHPTTKIGFYETHIRSKRIIGCMYLGEAKGEIKLQTKEISDAKYFTYKEAIQLPLGFQYRKVLEDLHQREHI